MHFKFSTITYPINISFLNFHLYMCIHVIYSSSSPNLSTSRDSGTDSPGGVINKSFVKESEGVDNRGSPDVTISEINENHDESKHGKGKIHFGKKETDQCLQNPPRQPVLK